MTGWFAPRLRRGAKVYRVSMMPANGRRRSEPVPSRPPRGTLAAASVVGPASRKGAGRPRALRGHPRFRRCSVSCPSAELPRWRRPAFVTALSPSAIDDARDDRRRGGRGSQGRGGRRRGCGEESGEGQEGGGKRALRNSIATPRRPGQTGSAPSRRPSTTIGSSALSSGR